MIVVILAARLVGIRVKIAKAKLAAFDDIIGIHGLKVSQVLAEIKDFFVYQHWINY